MLIFLEEKVGNTEKYEGSNQPLPAIFSPPMSVLRLAGTYEPAVLTGKTAAVTFFQVKAVMIFDDISRGLPLPFVKSIYYEKSIYACRDSDSGIDHWHYRCNGAAAV